MSKSPMGKEEIAAMILAKLASEQPGSEEQRKEQIKKHCKLAVDYADEFLKELTKR